MTSRLKKASYTTILGLGLFAGAAGIAGAAAAAARAHRPLLRLAGGNAGVLKRRQR